MQQLILLITGVFMHLSATLKLAKLLQVQEAARLLGLSQPDVSRLLRGDFRSIRWSACSGS